MDATKIIFSTGDPAYAVDKKGEIVIWNRAAESAFGYSASTAVGQRCWKLLAGHDIYGNEYCSRHCPLRAMAFSHKSVNSCKIYFKTGSREIDAFMVSTLVLYNGPGGELLTHLCRPEIDGLTEPTERPVSIRPANNHKRGSVTAREKEVLVFIAEGKTTREIASVMCISVNTVRNHIRNILFKFHVHSRLDAVSVGRQLNLI